MNKLIFLIPIILSAVHSHSQNSVTFEYRVEKIILAENVSDAGLPDRFPAFTENNLVLNTLNAFGKGGWELVSATPFSWYESNSNKRGVSLIFKRQNDPGFIFFQRQAAHIDSIAEKCAREEINKTRVDLIALVNEHTKNTISKELSEQLANTFESMLASSMDKLKLEILKHINKK